LTPRGGQVHWRGVAERDHAHLYGKPQRRQLLTSDLGGRQFAPGQHSRGAGSERR
jgi:hypothetical protein